MEKRRAHYSLVTVRQLIGNGRVRFTMTAAAGGAAMGFDTDEMLDVISSLTNRNLYKSMTSHADHTMWHDVYHATARRKLVYLKLMIVEDLLIVSFKEKDR